MVTLVHVTGYDIFNADLDSPCEIKQSEIKALTLDLSTRYFNLLSTVDLSANESFILLSLISPFIVRFGLRDVDPNL